MTTTRMMVTGVAVLLALILIGDGLVAAIVIGLVGFGLLLLTMSSGPQRRARDLEMLTATRHSAARHENGRAGHEESP